MVSDKNAVFYNDRIANLDQILDELSSALILIEDSEKPVAWMKPEDISSEGAIKALLNNQSQHHRTKDTLLWTVINGTHAVFAVGAAYQINPTADPELIRQMINVNDGYSPDPKLVAGPQVIYKPQGFIALAFYIGLLALPGWILWKRRNDKRLAECKPKSD